ncbi:MAG: hypothetical protein RLZZ502_1434 [Pseudomonadota bacterium]|jgi:hypothetical protein
MFDLPTMLMIAVVGLAFLLLMLLIRLKGSYGMKLALIACTTLGYFFVDHGVRQLGGWPVKQALPEKFILLAVVFDEPDPARGNAGALYLWVNEIINNKPVPEPRGYKLPYQKDLHGILAEAMKKNRNGITQLGKAEPKPQKGGLTWLRGGAEDTQDVKIQDMPTPQLPEK